jgi:hypothetical protein
MGNAANQANVSCDSRRIRRVRQARQVRQSGSNLFRYDLPGFGIRLRGSAGEDGEIVVSKRMTYVCRYENAGIQRKLKIGDAVLLTPDEACEKAKRAMAIKTLFGDPAVNSTEEKAKLRLTLKHITNQYLQRRQSDMQPKSLTDAKRYSLKSFRSLLPLPFSDLLRNGLNAVTGTLSPSGIKKRTWTF